MDFLSTISAMTGISPEELLLYLGVLVAVANLVGRLIPDDQTGWLGFVRKVAKVIGLYASNRVKSNVTVNDVANASLTVANIAKTARNR